MIIRIFGVTTKKHNEIIAKFNDNNITFATEWDAEPGLYNISFDTLYDTVNVGIYDKHIAIFIVNTGEFIEVRSDDFEIIKIV